MLMMVMRTRFCNISTLFSKLFPEEEEYQKKLFMLKIGRFFRNKTLRLWLSASFDIVFSSLPVHFTSHQLPYCSYSYLMLDCNDISVKWGHLGHFDLESNFPTNPMGSSGPLWTRLYNNNYKNQNKN